MTESQTAPTTQPAKRPYTPGVFVWHEYVGRDTAGARKFYADLLGWTIKEMPMGAGAAYPEIFVGDKAIGGFFQTGPEQGEGPAFWVGYLSVPDVGAVVEQTKAAGGRVLAGPLDVPEVGTLATLMDPEGAVFAVIHSLNGDPDTEGMPAPTEFCWDSLGFKDVAVATGFYQKVIGWQAVAGDDPNDGVFKMGDKMEASFDRTPEGKPAHWLGHIFVPKLAEARTRVEQLGGQVLMAQIDTPWGDFAVVKDPYGAVFSLFEGKDMEG